jgi:catechol 2,3-dioxygenase-like lactoylglutathione lyase family enzyme
MIRRFSYLVCSLSILVLCSTPRAEAQLVDPGTGGVAMGHLHLTVPDLEAGLAFWHAFGGTSVMNGRLELIQVPGTFVMLREADPTGGSVGSTVNHVGFHVRDMAAARATWEQAGLEVEDGSRPEQAYLTAPGPVRVEILEDQSLTAPVEMDHIHFNNSAPAEEVQAWYAKHFGAEPVERGRFAAGNVPGVALLFSSIDGAWAPTRGRGLDHIGFEVRDLEAFCEKLEAAGLTFDRPYGLVPGFEKLAIAYLTDPWGTYIELTEFLAP